MVGKQIEVPIKIIFKSCMSYFQIGRHQVFRYSHCCSWYEVHISQNKHFWKKQCWKFFSRYKIEFYAYIQELPITASFTTLIRKNFKCVQFYPVNSIKLFLSNRVWHNHCFLHRKNLKLDCLQLKRKRLKKWTQFSANLKQNFSLEDNNPKLRKRHVL